MTYIKGHVHSKEVRKNMSKNHADVSGDKNPMWKGGIKTYCMDCRKQISGRYVKRCKPCADKDKKGKPIWKGDNVGYTGVHDWVRANKGKPQVCEHCGKTKKESKIEWANVDHKYRRKLEDYISLCTACHRKYDKIQRDKKVSS